MLAQVPSCFVAGQDVCENGYCSNSTHTCTCYDGFSGITCQVRECPKGFAFFDEPTSSNTAHALAECSNAGICDRSTGFCKCNPLFTGAACQIKDCVRDPTTGAKSIICQSDILSLVLVVAVRVSYIIIIIFR